jgi:hypothetical protein
MLGKQLQLVEGEQQWEPYGVALIRHEQELQQVLGSQKGDVNTGSVFNDHRAMVPMQAPFCPEKCTVLYATGSSGCTGVASEQCVVIYENKWVKQRSSYHKRTARRAWQLFEHGRQQHQAALHNHLRGCAA